MLLPTVAGLLKVKMLPEIDRSDNSFVASASASLGLIVLFPPFTKEIIFPVASIDKSCVSCLQFGLDNMPSLCKYADTIIY